MSLGSGTGAERDEWGIIPQKVPGRPSAPPAPQVKCQPEGPLRVAGGQGQSLMRVPLASTRKKGKTRSPRKAAEKVCTCASVSAL